MRQRLAVLLLCLTMPACGFTGGFVDAGTGDGGGVHDGGGTHDGGTTDAGGQTDGGPWCGTLAPPGTSGLCCSACAAGQSGCQANGCYGGWYCDTASCQCKAPSACGGGTDGGVTDAGVDGGTTDGGGGNPAGEITVGEWNLDWFGDPTNGPTDDNLQQQNVTSVVDAENADLWSFEEVVDTSRIAQVVQTLPGFGLVVATDSNVAGNYSFTGAQQVAIAYRKSIFTFVSAKIVLGNDRYDFAERPPLEVTFDVNEAGRPATLYVISLHMKAYSDTASYDRRLAASGELKTYLDNAHPNDQVMVIGDWNDDLDTSISGNASPYANFVSDTADYFFPTKTFTDNGIGTMVGDNTPIDHHMVTNELQPYYVSGSAIVFHPSISNQKTTTTDHYPTFVHYRF